MSYLFKLNVFISFDYDNDRRYKYMLEAWDANSQFAFVFNDETPRENDSDNIGRIKGAITSKINNASHTLVIIGSEANKWHKDSQLIGHKNWINFEIYQSKFNRNKLIGVKLSPYHISPDELLNENASWAMSFTQQAIINALNNA